MKTMTETEVREQWGETLASLAVEKEVVITSGDRVVARLLAEDEPPRKQFDAEEHLRWLKETWGDETFDSLTPLMEDREDRVLISESAWAAYETAEEKQNLAAEAAKPNDEPRDAF